MVKSTSARGKSAIGGRSERFGGCGYDKFREEDGNLFHRRPSTAKKRGRIRWKTLLDRRREKLYHG